MQLYRYFVSQSSEFCRHNPLCCFSADYDYYYLFVYFVVTQKHPRISHQQWVLLVPVLWALRSAVATRLQAGRPGFDSWQGQRFFSSPPHPDRLWGPPSLPSIGYRGLWVKRQDVKLVTHLQLVPRLMRGALPPLPQYAFVVWCVVSHRDHFTSECCVHSGSDYCQNVRNRTLLQVDWFFSKLSVVQTICMKLGTCRGNNGVSSVFSIGSWMHCIFLACKQNWNRIGNATCVVKSGFRRFYRSLTACYATVTFSNPGREETRRIAGNIHVKQMNDLVVPILCSGFISKYETIV
jgi:hypothetical protein